MTKKPSRTSQVEREVTQQLQLVLNRASNFVLQQGRTLAGLGQQYGNKRDIYKAAGYKHDLEFRDYYNKYRRQDIAKRVVGAPATATWREVPELLDGDKGETDFIKAWQALDEDALADEQISDKKSIWHYCARVDRISGIGRFGVLLIGVNDGKELDKPLEKGSAKSLSYLHPYDEGCATITKWGTDPTDRRFNLPIEYEIDLGADVIGTTKVSSKKVHWSRVIHVAEELDSNEFYGTPRLEAVFNRFFDLEKVVAGAAEAAWKLMNKGMVISYKDDVDFEDEADVRTAIENYAHDLTRVLELSNANVTMEGGEVVDPTGLFKVLIALVSGATGIPQRILLGSEAGHLASDQDEKNWAQRIMTRKTEFAEPVILRPLINRLIFCGVLPPPKSGSYKVKWDEISRLTPVEQAQKEASEAQAFAASVGEGKMDAITYLRKHRGWTDEDVKTYWDDLEERFKFDNQDFVTDISPMSDDGENDS